MKRQDYYEQGFIYEGKKKVFYISTIRRNTIIYDIVIEGDKADIDFPYETMVFKVEDNEINWEGLEQVRYKTREEAMKGHEEVVDKWLKKVKLGYYKKVKQ